MTGSTMTSAEIAALFGWKLATFLRKRRELVAAGFPRPLPIGAGTPVWSRALVDAWIAAGGIAADVEPTAIDPIGAARQALEARIGGAA